MYNEITYHLVDPLVGCPRKMSTSDILMTLGYRDCSSVMSEFRDPPAKLAYNCLKNLIKKNSNSLELVFNREILMNAHIFQEASARGSIDRETMGIIPETLDKFVAESLTQCKSGKFDTFKNKCIRKVDKVRRV